ncbi:MAG TPA: transketolase C-terminal domain-containing protein [Candidatus Omnitrophota bacterium]|nr:transketolase C-terminal domain-containing protein [Candidatus Omnitrophota bacterium]HPN66013.1 transketolase C-terminal domain-containing protein [Candidatus Omnitrophota bacterium]
MSKKLLALTGNDAAAYAMKQINPDVVAAYPITPQTSLMEKFAQFVADGEINTEVVLVESEHSAMSACVGASCAGARVMTATSSQGLALMWEIVYIASSYRLPIVMPLVNRALSGPINIHCDHGDAMGIRDSGWIQLWAENAQEVYDNLLQAIRIAENSDVLLPVVVNYDGFIISHAIENMYIYDAEEVKKFVGEYKPKYTLLDPKKPTTFGGFDLPDYYFEHRRQMAAAMSGSAKVIADVGKEFSKICGREYKFTEGYKLEDAEIVIVALGSTVGTARAVVDELREKGVKAGILKIRVFRPFPEEEIAGLLKDRKAVAVLDRADALNAVGGPLFDEVRGALYKKSNAPVVNYIYGLGGRDMGLAEINKVYGDLAEIAKSGRVANLVTYLGVRD